MADAKKKRKINKDFWLFIFLAIIYLIYLYIDYKQNQQQTANVNGVLYVHMIDCGQADSFLFEYEGEYALIDCGTKSTGRDVVEYLKKQNVNKLKFVIGTHPHDDHMGGMKTVIENFETELIYMPETKDGLVTSDWYISLLQEIKKDNISVENPSVNDKYYLGDAVFNVVEQLTPEEAGNNINDYSTVVKVSFGEMDLLMTGDAEKKVESKIMQSHNNLECEILKLGHHGSDTSTSDKFLDEVNPQYGLISCGVDNKYNHPCESTMQKLKDRDIQVYRTDEVGDVVVSITSDEISFDKDPGSYNYGKGAPEFERGIYDD